jgi:GMP synthase (glutamine-hydrolysing)
VFKKEANQTIHFMTTRNDIRILLVQFRDDPFIKKQELDSFVRQLRVQPEQITCLDVFNDDMTTDVLAQHDVLIVGGNGAHTLSQQKDLPYSPGVQALLRTAYDKRMPTLGVCFGAQYMAVEFGGTLESIPEMKEVGTYTLTVTPDGSTDPLFAGMDSTFSAQEGHNDSVTALPDGMVRLASSERVQNQAFRFPDRLFYGVQYHPELAKEQFMDRLNYYKEKYVDNADEMSRLLDTIGDSHEAGEQLSRFIDLALEELSD